MRDYCDAQAGFWLNSKFWSKFSRKPLSGIEDQKAPPFRKTSDLGWPKFTPEYPPPHFGKLQIWDDQSLLRNTPPISENFRFGMTKVYSGIPPSNENCQRVQVGDFLNTEIYYMWRLYPTRITTSFYVLAGPRSRKTKKQETPAAEEKRPRTAFNAQQLGRLKVCELRQP